MDLDDGGSVSQAQITHPHITLNPIYFVGYVFVWCSKVEIRGGAARSIKLAQPRHVRTNYPLVLLYRLLISSTQSSYKRRLTRYYTNLVRAPPPHHTKRSQFQRAAKLYQNQLALC